MAKRNLLTCVVAAAVMHVMAYAQEHTTYTVVEQVAIFGPAMTMTVSRSGQKVVIDQGMPSAQAKTNTSSSRTLFDLQRHVSYTWSPPKVEQCATGTFEGWGDPFASSAAMMSDLEKQHVTVVGTETVNGFQAKIFETASPDAKVRVWADTKTNVVVREQVTDKEGNTRTIMEVTQVSLNAPPSEIFILPASCNAAGPPPPTEADEIAKLTGGRADDYAKAIMPPASKNSCSVLVKVVKAGTLEPITGGFQIAVDLSYDVHHPPHDSSSVRAGGKATFSGGGVHDMTAQLRGGVLRLDNVPESFDVQTQWGNAGSSDALIYRQCFALQTKLLFVVKNPARLSDGGDWLWVKH